MSEHTGNTTTMDRIRHERLIAVVRGTSHSHAIEVANHLIDAGITALEITYTTPHAGAVIAELRSTYGDRVLLGAGTLCRVQHVDEAAAAGAAFLVSPGSTPPLITAMLDTGRLTVPGALTPTEIMTAMGLGAHLIKLFPGSALGPDYLAALRGPFPTTEFMPTGGVNAGNLPHWLQAGAVAVGVGGPLSPVHLRTAAARQKLRSAAAGLLAALAAANNCATAGNEPGMSA